MNRLEQIRKEIKDVETKLSTATPDLLPALKEQLKTLKDSEQKTLKFMSVPRNRMIVMPK